MGAIRFLFNLQGAIGLSFVGECAMAGRPVRPELLDFAERFRGAVKAIGTQAEVARIAGISVQQVRRYTSGRNMPPVDVLTKVSAASGLRVEWLLSGEGPMRREGDPVRRRLDTLTEMFESAAARALVENEHPGLVALHDEGKDMLEVSRALQDAGLYEALAEAGYPLDYESLSEVRALELELAAPLREVEKARWPAMAKASVRAFGALLSFTSTRARQNVAEGADGA